MDTKNKQPFIEQGEGNIGIHDVNQDSHDIITNHTVNQNQTFVYSGEAGREKLIEEKIEEYRQFCKQEITSQIIDKRLKLKLQEKALSLSLDESVTTKIEELVKSSLSSSGLSPQDIRTIDAAIDGIKDNDVTPIINRIIALSDRSDADEVQYYANLLLVAEDPRKCIARYERAPFDNYWQMFWTYVAYLRQRNPEKAEKVRSKLNDNLEKSEDLLLLLSGVGYLVEYYANNGAESYRNTAIRDLNDYRGGEPLTESFVEALKVLIKQQRPLYFTNNKELDFYFRLFGAKKKQQQTASFSQSGAQPFSAEDTKTVYDIAHEVAAKTSPSPAVTPPPVYVNVPNSSTNLKKWAFIAVAAFALIWFFTRNNSSDKNENQEIQVATELAEAGANENTEVQLNTGSRRQSTATQKAQSTETSHSTSAVSENSSLQNPSESSSRIETSQPVQTTSQNVSSTPSTSTAKETITASTEMSAAELLSKGKSAVKKFKAEQGAEYFRQAIAKGSIEANYYLGELYYNGNGVAKSFPTAKSYFQKAANAGMADAQYMIGVMFRNGQGGDKDINEAKRWLQKAAAQGNTNAERLLNQLN